MPFRPIPVGFSGSLWGNGEFGYSRLREITVPRVFEAEPFTDFNSWVDEDGVRRYCPDSVPGSPPPSEGGIGLSLRPNSDIPDSPQKRRGLRGISSYGRRMVRNACYEMRGFIRDRRLSFLTVTLPSVSEGELEKIAGAWSDLQAKFIKTLRRDLIAGGLPAEICGVTEIQEQRYESSGLPVLHSHYVFVGRRRGKDWVLSPGRVTDVWVGLLERVVGRDLPRSASVRIESVRKSAEGYMGKYMSKGVRSVRAVVDEGLERFLPRTWYTCTKKLRLAVLSKIRRGSSVGMLLDSITSWGGRQMVEFCFDVTIPVDGVRLNVGRVGKLSNTGRLEVLSVLPDHDKIAPSEPTMREGC